MNILALLLPVFLHFGVPALPNETRPVAVAPDLALESFEVFFDRFRESKHFQLKRTVFPMEQHAIALETETSTIYKVEKADWTPLAFDKQGLLKPLGGESVTQEIKNETTLMRIEIRGTNSSISVDYEFERRVGKWYLVVMRSYSN